ncbi:MAG: hypothetical protein LQ341_001094 [Variospora aurantia]|nr:MAG: hypothetical protein LQ341_001094 [Variospora aurantia]
MAGNLSDRDRQELDRAHDELNLAPVLHWSECQYFHVVPIPGKGQGCRARTNIPRGTCIHEEKPLFSVKRVEIGGMSPATRQRLTHELNRLRPDQYQQFLTLTCPGRSNDQDQERFEVNNFQMIIEDAGFSQQGVFLHAARFNHSCLPNAWFNWNPLLGDERRPAGRLTVYTVRNIQMGEEILVDYQNTNCYEGRITRRRNLHRDYAFTCNCDACGYRQRGHLSEERRAAMRAAEALRQANQGQHNGQRWNLRESIVRLSELLDQEGIVYPQQATLSGELAEWYYRELGLKNPLNLDLNLHDQFLEASRARLKTEVLCLGEKSEEIRLSLDATARR